MDDAEIHIGYVFLDDVAVSTLPRLTALLRQSDQVRLGTLHRFEDRVAFAVGRLLLRKMLNSCASEPAGGWLIEILKSGMPVLQHSDHVPDLRFNITHCHGLVAVVVAKGREVGVDAEFIAGTGDYLGMARMHLPSPETTFLETLDGTKQRDAFFRLWTLREAYFKALGEGLSGQSSDLFFSLDPPRVAAVNTREVSADWYFSQQSLSPSHILAVAARHKPLEEIIFKDELFQLQSLCIDDGDA